MSIIDLISEIEHVNVTDHSFMIVKVGTEDRPATTTDIENIRQDMKQLFDDVRKLNPDFPRIACLITHHAVEFKLFTCQG
ncbi:MAG: hypothetical protein ACXAC5_03550 [Promethearchaeota archaeon]|jgi:hypothetical protein